MSRSAPVAVACPRPKPLASEVNLGRQRRVQRQPSTRGVTAGLVFAIMALPLGLAAVVASLMVEDEIAGLGWRPRGTQAGHAASTGPVRETDPGAMRPLEWSTVPVPLAALDDLPLPRSGGAPKSRLYPQNGVTFWDRIRVSSPRDRHAFLFGTAIQVHAPAVAATPGRQD